MIDELRHREAALLKGSRASLLQVIQLRSDSTVHHCIGGGGGWDELTVRGHVSPLCGPCLNMMATVLQVFPPQPKVVEDIFILSFFFFDLLRLIGSRLH